MGKTTVFVVDDNPELRDTLKENLELDGYEVLTASNGEELIGKLKTCTVDAILLDLVLPDGNGLSFIEKIRSYTDAPVIVVSGKGEMVDKVVGLEMGADDYIGKPFAMRELSARVKANIRRYKAHPKIKADEGNSKQNIRFEGWVLDRSKLQLFDKNGQSAELTVSEFRLLEALLMSPNRVLSRDQLLSKARATDFDVYDRAIDVQITRIRKKIENNPQEPQIIRTVRGAGYMLVASPENCD